MTIDILGPLMATGLFSGARANVFQALANHADEHGECWPSYDCIAHGARCKRETAMREVKWLEKHGCIEVFRGSERPEDKAAVARRSNIYKINLPLVDALDYIIKQVMKLSGRDPGKRYGNAGKVAQWASDTIENFGTDVLISALQIFIKGDVTSLLRMCNSDLSSPLEGSRGDIHSARGDLSSPKPSIEPSSEPSADFSHGENRKDEDGEGENSEARERRQAAELKLLIGWVLSRSVERLDALALGREGRDLIRDEADRFALSIEGPMRNKADSWVRWARAIIDKTDNGARQTTGVLRLVAALEDAIVGAGVSARCDQMLADSDTKAGKLQHTEDQQTDNEEAA